jgi:hypothetical protein
MLIRRKATNMKKEQWYISGSHGDEYEDDSFLGYGAV